MKRQRVIPGCVAAFLAAWTLVAGAEVKPQHFWDFDKKGWWSRLARDLGEAKGRKPDIPGKLVAGQGVAGSAALMAAEGSHNTVFSFPLEYDAFTFDMSFRLSEPLKEGRARVLWCYHWAPSSKNRFMARLTGSGRIEISLGEYQAVSEPLGVKDGVLYAFRLAVSADGTLAAWLDGREILRRKGAPSLNSIRAKSAKGSGFPVLILGACRVEKRTDDRCWLEGVIDDFAMYDTALGAPELKRPPVDFSSVALPEFRHVDGGSMGLMLFDESGRAETGRFRVLDREQGVFGQMHKASSEFTDNASYATLTFTGGVIDVVVECPVPKGMTTVKRDQPWAGDRVEMFIRPSMSDEAFCLYIGNAAGNTTAHGFYRDRMRNMSWKPKAKISVSESGEGFRVAFSVPVSDVFKTPPRKGEPFGINIIRYGGTCGGKSMWSTSGSRFNNASAPFGIAVFGGSAAYFRRKLEDRESFVARRFTDPETRSAASAALGRVREAVEVHGADVKSFSSLERMFTALERSFAHISLGGRPIAVYKPADIWGPSPEPDPQSRPLDIIRVRAPLNARTLVTAAVSNFRDDDYLGQIKFFDRSVSFQRSDWYDPVITNGVSRNFTVMRGFPIRNRDGNRLYDPVTELPMQTVLRLAPGETAPLYFELDTRGMKPGRYYSLLFLKKAVPGFTDVRIPVEVEVLDVDLGGIESDRFCYSFADSTFFKTRHPCPRYVELLVKRGYNMLLLWKSSVDCFPHCDAKGKWHPGSMRSVDRFAEAALAAGLPKERLKFVVYLRVEKNSTIDGRVAGLTDHQKRRIPFGTPQWDEGMRHMVRFFTEHVKAKYGVGKDRIYWYPVDEPHGDINDPSLKSSISRAYHAAKVIKSCGKDNLTMTDPLPNFLASKKIEEAWPKLLSVYDAIELYRPNLSREKLDLVKKNRPKEVWTYSIISKETPPSTYCMDHWRNMRDGFRGLAAWWHMDQASGGDPFDSTDGGNVVTDYATLYVDFDHDTQLLSRRQLAADQAAEDVRLIMYLRGKFADDAAKLAAVEAAVKEAADSGTVRAAEAARERLLDLASSASQEKKPR